MTFDCAGSGSAQSPNGPRSALPPGAAPGRGTDKRPGAYSGRQDCGSTIARPPPERPSPGPTPAAAAAAPVPVKRYRTRCMCNRLEAVAAVGTPVAQVPSPSRQLLHLPEPLFPRRRLGPWLPVLAATWARIFHLRCRNLPQIRRRRRNSLGFGAAHLRSVDVWGGFGQGNPWIWPGDLARGRGTPGFGGILDRERRCFGVWGACPWGVPLRVIIWA